MDFLVYFIALCYAEFILFVIQNYQNDPVIRALDIQINRYPYKIHWHKTQIKILEAEKATRQEWSDWYLKVYAPMLKKYPEEADAFMEDYVGFWVKDLT